MTNPQEFAAQQQDSEQHAQDRAEAARRAEELREWSRYMAALVPTTVDARPECREMKMRWAIASADLAIAEFITRRDG